MLRGRWCSPARFAAGPLLFGLMACSLSSEAQAPYVPREPIRLTVDATEAPRRILHAHLSMPVKPGPLVLAYPQWIPGEHAPSGPVGNVAGLRFWAAGKALGWQRDPGDMFAFRVEVPPGAATLDVDLDYLLPAEAEGFSSAVSSTPVLVDLSWNQLLLYPRGAPSDALTYAARLKLPAGWRFGSALPAAGAPAADGAIEFSPVSLTTLVDSPVAAGLHVRTLALDAATHRLVLVADSDKALEIPEPTKTALGRMVEQAAMLFGARHYASYTFLWTLSDHIASFGLEHHESSDNRSAERTLLDEAKRKSEATLLPHELIHSWNGKYRRPVGLATKHYGQPMLGDLLWVYEGLTTYLAAVLATRSGLWSADDFRDDLARTIAVLDATAGRRWRPLGDTAVAAQLLYGASSEWASWRRGTDFYDEGGLFWLAADLVIRERSGGQKSLDDFCRRFLGGKDGPPTVAAYTLDDVIGALNDVAPYDWRGLVAQWIGATSSEVPRAGLSATGWRLVYDDKPNDAFTNAESERGQVDMSLTLGLVLRRDGGRVVDVVPGRPAAVAGLGPGMRVIALGGRRFTPDAAREVLTAGKGGRDPLEVVVENGDLVRTVRIDYHDGDRFPRLERVATAPDRLAEILAPRTAPAPLPARR